MKPRNHVTLAMLRAPKRGSLVHKGKLGNHRKDLNMETEQDWCDEDVPTWNITITIPVQAWDDDRAVEYLEGILEKAKAEAECALYDWDIEDISQA